MFVLKELIAVNIRFLSINCNFIRMSSSERRISTCNSFLFQNFVHDEDLGLVVFSREKTLIKRSWVLRLYDLIQFLCPFFVYCALLSTTSYVVQCGGAEAMVDKHTLSGHTAYSVYSQCVHCDYILAI